MNENKKQQRFCLGDVHGHLEPLQEVLKKCEFDYDNDFLITLGDIVDRGDKSFECVEELFKIKNRIDIKGNHDENFYNIMSGRGDAYFKHGSTETIQSYINNCNPEKIIHKTFSGYYTDFDIFDYPKSHFDFFQNQKLYYILGEDTYFVHGGINRHYPIDEQIDNNVFYNDRDFWAAALSHTHINNSFKINGDPKKVFIGHTPTTHWKSSVPMKAANGVIINLDTGCGKGGKLTIMNIDTEEFFQSDNKY